MLQNTSTPASKHPSSTEGAGPVASDSLAADSTRSGEGFAQNRDSEPLAVKGANSTFANDDTSGATTLAAAPDAATRDAKTTSQETSDEIKGPGGTKYVEGAGGQGEFSGGHTAGGYSGGSTEAKAGRGSTESASASTSQTTSQTTTSASTSGKKESSSGGDEDSTPTTSSSHPVDTAPGYINSAAVEAARTGKPHGKNITEGGFDTDDNDDGKNNASFTSDIGDENDPGRAAEGSFQRQTVGNEGSGPRQKEVTGDGQFDVLETDQDL